MSASIVVNNNNHKNNTKNRDKESDNLIIIKSFVYSHNLKINEIVSELKTKCNFDFNGCQEVREFIVLSSY